MKRVTMQGVLNRLGHARADLREAVRKLTAADAVNVNQRAEIRNLYIGLEAAVQYLELSGQDIGEGGLCRTLRKILDDSTGGK